MLDGMVREMLDSSLNYANEQVSNAIGGQTSEYLNIALKIEQYIDGLLSIDSFQNIYKSASAIAIVLILLVFLKKGFDTYVLWREGDPELSPVRLLERVGIALVLLFLFNPLYDVAFDVSRDIYNDVFLIGVGTAIEQLDDKYTKAVLEMEQNNVKEYILLSHTRAEVHERLSKRKEWQESPQGLTNILDSSKMSDERFENLKRGLVNLDKQLFHLRLNTFRNHKWGGLAKLVSSIIEFFLWYQMMKVGIQILILRLIAPFIIVNLLSSNPTLYLSYIGLLGKSIAAVILQLFVYLLGYNFAYANGNIWIGILVMASSLKVQALIMSLTTNLGVGGEAGAASRTAYTAARAGSSIFRTIRSLKGVFSR